jgi:dipeptidyl aminopeptidase/acylaminoacyl peptidase
MFRQHVFAQMFSKVHKMRRAKNILLILGLWAQYVCAQEHSFDVRDSINLTTFNMPSEEETNSMASFSPDRRYFVVVTSRGLMEHDEIESSLGILDTSRIRSFINGGHVGTMLSPRIMSTVVGVPRTDTFDSYGALITDVRWSPDSQSVYFLKQESSGYRSLYSVGIKGGSVHRVTPHGYDVTTFDIVRGTIACMLSQWLPKKDDETHIFGSSINLDALDVTGMSLMDIIRPDRKSLWRDPREVWLWVERKSRQGHIIGSSWIDNNSVGMLSLSPSGRWAVSTPPVSTVPESWAEYVPPSPSYDPWRIKPHDPGGISPRNSVRLREYTVVDFAKNPHGKQAEFRVDAPNARALGVGALEQGVWSADESRLLLTNTFLPLSGVDEIERAKRVNACLVAGVEMASHQVSCIEFRSRHRPTENEEPRPSLLESVSFGKDKDEVLMRYRGELGILLERYNLRGREWVLVDSKIAKEPKSEVLPTESSAGNQEIQISIKQGLNQAPILWAVDTHSNKAAELWSPNQQLGRMRLGEASVYHWKDRTGFEWSGALVKPTNYVPGKRYPLVIQTHGFHGEIFKEATDGAYPTAMAARPLASAGIMVLQIPDKPGQALATAKEAIRHVDGFEGAIEQLDAEGLVDPTRVGVVGFSRTCWYVETALIEHPKMFVAATIADGVDESYFQYHLNPLSAPEFEAINGAKPVGEQGLKAWLESAPGFKLDKVQTPVLIQAINPSSVLLEWEIYSSLRQQGKPVDMLYIPEGQHILQRPLDRLASQQATVDWFAFWLLGYERPNPENVEQYKLWNHLREVRDADKKVSGGS